MNKGFFSGTQLPKTSMEKGLQCGKCGLRKGCHSPRMEGTGSGKTPFLFLAEAPGKQEDQEGVQMAGPSGDCLRKAAKKVGIPFDHCRKLNAVNCRPPENRNPTGIEIEACRPMLHKEMKDHPPHTVVLMGAAALQSYFGKRYTRGIGSLLKWRGFAIPDWERNCWVIPTIHPSYVLRMREVGFSNKTQRVSRCVADVIFEQDLALAADHLGKKLPPSRKDDRDRVEILSVKDSVKYLDSIPANGKQFYAFDYETTGLKPHRKGHRIVSCGIAESETGRVVVFPVRKGNKEALAGFLSEPGIRKVAANNGFEEIWSRECLDIDCVEGWEWDVVLGAHVLDNRDEITSVKFQSAVRLGVFGYDDEIRSFLRASVEEQQIHGANAINRIDEAELREVLIYCGLDALYEMEIAKQQMVECEKKDLEQAMDLMLDGIECFADIRQNGFPFDRKKAKEVSKIIDDEIQGLQDSLSDDPYVIQWQETYGKSFAYSNKDQLANILFTVNKIEPKKKTKGGAPSVDEEALSELDLPFVNELLEMRRLEKAKNTYLAGFQREEVDGLIHPFFNLNLVKTYRSSSNSPNFQNIPVRNPKIKKLLRSTLFPSPGNHLVEIDYSGIEVRVAACYHKDPTMLAYIKDPSKDMHTDMAARCYLLDPDDVTKDARYCAKNKFVFPEFYGDYYKNCASNLWSAIASMKLQTVGGIPMREHLLKRRIRDPRAFEEHVRGVEDDFWYTRFKDYTQWKKDWWAEYQKKGFFDTLTGFTCSGIMGKNDAINYPVQGSAFHCLLWSTIEMNRRLREAGMDTVVIGQIHDSMILDAVPKELQAVLNMARKIMCEELRKEWKWIIVPLDIEAEVTPIDSPWLTKKEMVVIDGIWQYLPEKKTA